MFYKYMLYLIVILFFCVNSSNAQDSAIDYKHIDAIADSALNMPVYNVEVSKRYGDKVFESSSKIDYQKGKAKGLILLAQYYHMIGENINSTNYYLKAQEIIEKLGDVYLKCELTRELGENYRAIGEYQTAIEYEKNAINLAATLNNPLSLAKAYNRLAAVYYESNEYDKCEDFLDKSILICENHNYPDLLAENFNIYGALSQIQKNYYTSVQYLEKGLKIVKEIGSESVIPHLQMNLSTSYYHMKEYEKGASAGADGYNYAVKHKIKLYVYYCALRASMNFKMLGQLDSAYYYLNIAYEFRDSVLSERKIAMQTKYETEKKNKELQTESNLNYWKITVLFILLSSAIIIIISVRRKHNIVKEKNRLITIQNEELHELNVTKDKFFSIIAHDLKNPLGSIKVSIETMADNYELFEEEDRKDLMQEMKKASVHIYDLLENLLTWSRSQRGNIEFHPEKVNVTYLFNSLKYLVQTTADKKEISLIFNCDPGVTLFADVNMLNTIIRNLVTNAIKFTNPKGYVKVSASELIENGKACVKFSVEDNGVGISQNDILKLFRIDVSHTTIGSAKETGTGLGLVLCKEFVERHGGYIKVDSQLGKGSRFYFIIPQNQ